MAASRPASDRSSRASRGWLSPPATGARPTCEVTITRSPTTIGDDVPAPASGARHARCSVALHVVGSGASVEIAALPGPRHCGQSCAAAPAARGAATAAAIRPGHTPRTCRESRDMRAVYGTASGMRFVLPGGSGQVGQLLARAFQADGHDVVVLARRPARVRRTRGRLGRRDAGPLGRRARRRRRRRSTWPAAASTAATRRPTAPRCSTRGSARRGSSARPSRRRRGRRRVWIQASTATIYAHTLRAAARRARASSAAASPACRTRGGSASRSRRRGSARSTPRPRRGRARSRCARR